MTEVYHFAYTEAGLQGAFRLVPALLRAGFTCRMTTVVHHRFELYVLEATPHRPTRRERGLL